MIALSIYMFFHLIGWLLLLMQAYAGRESLSVDSA
jgi:hypothetical protein